MTEGLYIERSLGFNLRSVLASSLVKSTYEAIKEFVSNSYDADANNVVLAVNTLDDVLVIDDDGTGMDERGLQGFYRMGDSDKIASPLTAKGRAKIGQFGIATVLLEYLGNNYTLETWKAGKKIIVAEDFSAAPKTKSGLEYLVNDSAERPHGTRITLHGLKFKDQRAFTVERLVHVLRWEMPLLPDFALTVNGQKVEREEVKPSATYHFDEQLPVAGRIFGDMHYFNAPQATRGVYVYVNGRAVGDPQSQSLLSGLPVGLIPRILGMIHADGLRDHISFDRSRLQEDNPATREVLHAVKGYLRAIRQSERASTKDTTARLAKEALPEALAATREVLSKARLVGIERMRSDGKLAMELAKASSDLESSVPLEQGRLNGVLLGQSLATHPSSNGDSRPRRRPLEFVVADNDPSAGLAVYDAANNIVHINAHHPALSLQAVSSGRMGLHFQMVYAASAGIARRLTEAEYARDPAALQLLSKRERILAELSARIFGRSANIADLLREKSSYERIASISPNRLYSEDELRDNGCFDFMILRKLIESGAIGSKTSDHRFLGEDVLHIIECMKGYVPVFALVKDYAEDTKEVSRERIRQLGNHIELQLQAYRDQIEYVKDIGITSPFYLVEEGHVQKLLTLYSKGVMRLNKLNLNVLPAELAKRDAPAEVGYVTLRQAEIELDLPYPEVLGLLDRQVENGGVIRVTEDQGNILYSLLDMKRMKGKA